MIGAGNIGKALGHLLSIAGHDVRYGTRTPVLDRSITTVAEAASFGELIVFAAPFRAWIHFASENSEAITGKVIINAANPMPTRDIEVAEAALQSGEGSGRFIARLIPQSTVVQCFKTMFWMDLRDQTRRPSERVAMPLAGDSPKANDIVADLVSDVGFDPIVIGGLDRSSDIDPGGALFAKLLTAREAKSLLSRLANPAS